MTFQNIELPSWDTLYIDTILVTTNGFIGLFDTARDETFNSLLRTNAHSHVFTYVDW
jgi:hypothetical protein